MKFKAKLVGVGPKKAWTFMKIPFSGEKEFGARGQVRVRGTLNGFPYRSTLMPLGGGKHHMMINKQMQAGARAAVGDTVGVVMELDKAPRPVAVPAALRAALARNRRAKAGFDKLSSSHRRAYANFVAEARQADTRARRVAKTLAVLLPAKKTT